MDYQPDVAEKLVITLIRLRHAAVIAALYFAGFMIFGVPQWKAWLACAALILMQMMSFGIGRIRRVGIAFILVAGIYWIEILPLQKWSQIAGAKIDEAIALRSEQAQAYDGRQPNFASMPTQTYGR
jgi:hypothetical protein